MRSQRMRSGSTFPVADGGGGGGGGGGGDKALSAVHSTLAWKNERESFLRLSLPPSSSSLEAPSFFVRRRWEFVGAEKRGLSWADDDDDDDAVCCRRESLETDACPPFKIFSTPLPVVDIAPPPTLS